MPGFDELYTSDAKKLFDSNDAELLVLGNGLSIGFCVSSAEENRLDKTAFLSAYEWIGGTLREESSIIAPTITVEHEGFPNWNYAYIPNFNRYYFITDIVSVRLNLWRISFRCDPLMSFKEIIRETKAMVARNEFDFDLYVNDDLFPAEYDKEVQEVEPTNLIVPDIVFNPAANYAVEPFIAVTIVDPYETNVGNDVIQSPDSGYLPNIRPLPYIGTASYQTYAMTSTEFREIAKLVIDNDSLMSYIVSTIVYPFRLETFVPTRKVRIGKTETEIDSHMLRHPLKPYQKISEFRAPSISTFLGVDPYSTYEVYIPYCGWVKLPIEVCRGHVVAVYYSIDVISGTSTAYMYDKTQHRLIWSSPCQLGTKVTLTTTNALENKKTEEAANLNLIISTLGSFAATALGAFSGNPLTVAGGIMGGVRAVGSYVTTKNGIIDRAQATAAPGPTGMSSPQRLRLRTTRMISTEYSTTDFAHQYGRPLNQVRVIGNLTGHTVVSSVHLEIPGAYPSEVNEIEALLKEGFIA